MTLPTEELISLKYARDFLREIGGSKLGEIRKNARKIRKEALARLRHYPPDYVIDKLWFDRINGEERYLKS